MACLDEEMIERLARGAKASAALRRHLAACAECRGRVNEAREANALVREWRELRGLRASSDPSSAASAGSPRPEE